MANEININQNQNQNPNQNNTNDKKLIILITGSSGCLGQHIVRLLNEQQDDDDDSIKEIRCFDLKPYSNNLKHKITKEMKIITGDIRNEKQLIDAMKNVNIIINCAALIDLNLNPNMDEMQSVNVDGTQKLLEIAIEQNVEYFIQISGTDVHVGNDPIYYSSENTIIIPKKHLLYPYSKTKLDADELINEFNGKKLSNGLKQLKTVILRPTIMYGEEDQHFVKKILSITKHFGKQLRRIDNVFIRIQPVYVGNVAWACLKAKNRLLIDPKISGEEFIITDDTKIMDPFEFLEPFLQNRQFKLTKSAYPYWLFIMIFSLYCWLYKKFDYILSRIFIPIPEYMTPDTIKFLCNTYFFNRTKSTLRLDYDPLYNHDESIRRSLDYYKNCSI